MATRKTGKTTKDQTIYLGVLVRHLEEIRDHLDAVLAAAKQLGGRGASGGGNPFAIPGNILVDGRCQPAPPNRAARARTSGTRGT
jgi:hypothetical protein